MISEIKEFQTRMDKDIILTSARVSDYLRDLKFGVASSLCNWLEGARVKSVQQSSKLLHQLWTLKTIHEYLGAVKVEKY